MQYDKVNITPHVAMMKECEKLWEKLVSAVRLGRSHIEAFGFHISSKPILPSLPPSPNMMWYLWTARFLWISPDYPYVLRPLCQSIRRWWSYLVIPRDDPWFLCWLWTSWDEPLISRISLPYTHALAELSGYICGHPRMICRYLE